MRAPKARVFKYELKQEENIFFFQKSFRVFNAKKTLKNSSRRTWVRSTQGAASIFDTCMQ